MISRRYRFHTAPPQRCTAASRCLHVTYRTARCWLRTS